MMILYRQMMSWLSEISLINLGMLAVVLLVSYLVLREIQKMHGQIKQQKTSIKRLKSQILHGVITNDLAQIGYQPIEDQQPPQNLEQLQEVPEEDYDPRNLCPLGQKCFTEPQESPTDDSGVEEVQPEEGVELDEAQSNETRTGIEPEQDEDEEEPAKKEEEPAKEEEEPAKEEEEPAKEVEKSNEEEKKPNEEDGAKEEKKEVKKMPARPKLRLTLKSD